MYPGQVPTSPGLITFPSVSWNSIFITWTPLFGDDTGGVMLMPMTITYDIYVDDGWNGPFKYLDTTSGNSYNVTYLKSGLKY